jgi:ADP-ribose pyrophosphatase YjhB (NUDIX family)
MLYVGVGGFVVNDKNQILVIQEKNGPITSFWKIPGGRLDPGEEIHDAAIREVFEETGIKTEFQSLICFRSSQHSLHGKYVVEP